LQRKRLYSVDTINIGNRYSVYGFDGEYTLMGDSGWYLRNEVASVIPHLNTEVYLGLDVGAVYGKSAETLVGKTIAGTAIGIRGNYASGLLIILRLESISYGKTAIKLLRMISLWLI